MLYRKKTHLARGAREKPRLRRTFMAKNGSGTEMSFRTTFPRTVISTIEYERE
jgi:hypothetical protein